MFGGVAKIPIANTFNEFEGVDFAGYVDSSIFLQIRDDSPCFSVIAFTVSKK